MWNSESNHPRAFFLSYLIGVATSICLSFEGSNGGTLVMAASPEAATTTLYDSDPKHLWNRVHRALHIPTVLEDDAEHYAVRTIDPNDLDPFLWYPQHPDLLSGPAYREAIAVLDEFLDKRGEGLVQDALKRVFLQRDLWTLFDWSADLGWQNLDQKEQFVSERRELQTRLSQAIPRLALSANEIANLPDNYAAAVKSNRYPAQFHTDRQSAAYLPADLWAPQGPWVLLGSSAGGHLSGDHVSFFGGRSNFAIFLRLPEGRDQTLKYLHQLSDWQRTGPTTVKDVPQVPANTQVALARRTAVIDDRGEIQPTPLTELIQLRVVHDPSKSEQPDAQSFLQFRLRREQLLAGKAEGLSAVPDDEREWDYLFNLGRSGLARGVMLPIKSACNACHGNAPGIRTMRSFGQGSLQNEWIVTSLGDEERQIGAWKRGQASWKLLEKLKQSAPTR